MFDARQKGISPIGVLFVICNMALIVVLALKLTTHYLDYNGIRSAFQKEAELPGIKDAAPQQAWDDIDKQLRINSIRDFSFTDTSYINVNDEGVKVIGFEYEKREHIFANIDVVMTFKDEFEMK